MGDSVPFYSGYVPVNGASIYYEVAGVGSPLVLIHSAPLDSRMWDEQFGSLAKRYRVIRYDLRGFGRSRTSPGVFAFHEDLYTLMQHLEIDQAHVVGSSAGGAISIDFALQHPERVSALIPVASGVSGKRPSTALRESTIATLSALRSGDVAGAVDIAARYWVDGPTRDPRTVSTDVRDNVRKMYRENLLGEHPQVVPRLMDPPAIHRLGEIRVPTLVVTGDQDIDDILAVADFLTQGILGARGAVISGAGHMVNMERPEEFNTMIHCFLSGL